jgi:zinc protease
MRALAIALALVLAGVAPQAIAQPRAEQSATQAHRVPVQQVVSPGGVQAWLVSDSTVPMIVLRAYWRGGASLDEPRIFGVSTIMADMLTEGAGALDANAFKQRLEELNAQIGFGAGWDGVSMSITTLTANRDAVFDLARQTLASPRFDAAPLERIKRQVLVGIRQRETNPSFIGNLALDQALIAGHPYARRTTREGVSAITRADLQARRAALLRRGNLQITVVGDIDAQNLGRLLDSTFGALPQGAPTDTIANANIAAATPLIVRPLPQPQSLILFSAPGVQDEDPDWIPLAVANYILGGGGFSSRLMDQVREQRGLVYGISTSPSVRDHLALIRGSAQSENGDTAQAIQVTRDEIGKFYAQGATQAEVDDAIRYLTGSFALSLDSNVNISDVVHGYQVAGRDIDYINRRNSLISAVTLADVNRVIQRLYNPANFSFVVVGQPENLQPSAGPAAPVH